MNTRKRVDETISDCARSAITCAATKQRVVAELISGQLALSEATRRFQAAQVMDRNYVETTHLPCTVDAESAARAVIGWVHLALADRPEQADALSERLEVQLRELLERSEDSICSLK